MLKFRPKIKAIDGAEEHLLSVGIEAELRMMLKGDRPDDADPAQLGLWPDVVRALVGEINRARVFVPARNEFVELIPAAISRDEVNEAGDYLIAKGEDSIKVGKKLKDLSRLGRW